MVLHPSVSLFALGKFAIMPLLAYGVGRALHLPEEALVGMVILGACPGGVSANVMSYLAKANTTLTVLLTIFTTILSPLLTPLIIYAFFYKYISIDIVAMMKKLFWIILFPITDAIILRRLFAKYVDKVQPLCPSISMVAIGMIIGFVAAANRNTLLEHPWLILSAVVIFNVVGYAIGYTIAKLFRSKKETCRSVAFEYGMQDSAVGIIIATGFFSAAAALPSAICSLVQNLTGPMLVKVFKGRGR